MAGRYFTTGGKLYKTSTKEAKRILKSVIVNSQKEEPPDAPRDDDAVAPVLNLDTMTPAEAGAAILAIEMED